MKIKKITGQITSVIDISNTVKEIWMKPSEPLNFVAGSFINVFIDISGEKIRRAFSISSSSENQNEFSITVRLSPNGTISPLFWNKDMAGETIEIMGPLGLNTVDKMTKKKIYLFAYGVGAGVVKSIADYFSKESDLKFMHIMTGSKYADEILYKDYFDNLEENPKIRTRHIVSRSENRPEILQGYIQDHIQDLDFNDSDVYTCGQEEACNDLVKKIKEKEPANCEFFVEGFHK